MEFFPIVKEMNKARGYLHDLSHRDEHPFIMKTGCWFGHKVVSVISFPTNLAVSTAGVAGAVLSICTLGALKVSIFAVTLGNKQPTFPIGVLWLGERSVCHLVDCFYIVGENVKDGAIILQSLVLRFFEGCVKAWNDEGDIFPEQTPYIGELAQQTHLNSCFGESPNWFRHKKLSIMNLPLNVANGIACAALSIPSFVATGLKVSIYTLTKLHVSIPTGWTSLPVYSAHSFINAGENGVELIADGAVALYRIAEATHLMRVVATVGDVLAYIPKAIFS